MTSPTRSKFSNLKPEFVILGALILLGLILRLIRLDFQPLWWDEGYSVWFAGQSLADMVKLTARIFTPRFIMRFSISGKPCWACRQWRCGFSV